MKTFFLLKKRVGILVPLKTGLTITWLESIDNLMRKYCHLSSRRGAGSFYRLFYLGL